MSDSRPIPRLTRDGLADFQRVHTAIVAFHRQARPSGDMPADDAAMDSTQLADHAFQTLRAILDDIGLRPPVSGGKMDRRYVLACYADEAMINNGLGIERAWLSRLLEHALFRTRLAGERLIDEAREIVRTRDAGRRDVAMCAYLALSCGFRGRFRGVDDEGVLDQLAAGLYDVAMDGPLPATPDDLSGQVFSHTAGSPDAMRLTKSVSFWHWAKWLGGIAVIYCVLSYGIWLLHHDGLTDQVDTIIALEREIEDLRSNIEQQTGR